MNERIIYRASIRIHDSIGPDERNAASEDIGEFVSVHTTLGVAQRTLTDLHNAFGGRRVSPNVLGYGPTQKKADMQLAADALNIPVADLPAGMDRDEFDTFADSLVERWREQAIAARELLERLP